MSSSLRDGCRLSSSRLVCAPQVKAEASRGAIAAEVALVRQRMWETIQSFHTATVGKPAAKHVVDITATAAC